MEVETAGRRATQNIKGEIVSAGGSGGGGSGSSSSSSEESNCVDWRGRPSNPNSHGGMKAAVFVLGLQAFEIMGIAAVGNNLITYLINEMHFSLSKSANIVTNFIGTIFLLSLFGGYLSDSFLGSFWTMLIFGFVELSGFILLSVQAHVPQLKPPKCSNIIQDPGSCVEAKGFKSLIFFLALYLVALGSGCVKPNMIAHGADQFNAHTNPKHTQQLSTYFNAAYLAFSVGEIMALTLLVWVQTHSGMDIGFGISAAVMACGLVCLVSGILVYRHKRPQGSIFTPIAQVIVAAIAKRKQVCPSNVKLLYGSQSSAPNSYNNNTGRFGATSNNNPPHALLHTNRFRFLDKACIQVAEDNKKESPWRLCTVTQVEQVKILISVLPIFSCTIIFNTLLAQLQTFSVQQGSQMNNKLSPSFAIPPASLQSIPYLMLLFVVPVYDKLFVPLARKFTGHQTGITPLQRVGSGLFIATFSMVSAAIVEKRRRDQGDLSNIFWLTPQFLIFGVSEMLTAVGMIEFFYKQSVLLRGMQAFLMAVTYCSYSFGFYLSSVLVSLVNKVTGGGGGGWLSNNDLNKDRLDLFYWLLAGLSLLNFVQYVFWSKWYSNHPSAVLQHQQHVSPDEEDDDEELGGVYVDRHQGLISTGTQKERIGGKNAAAAAAHFNDVP